MKTPAKSEPQPREWWIDLNEWLDEAEHCNSGMAFSPKWLEEMEMTGHGMIHVIEKSAYNDLLVKYKKVSLEREECYATLDSIAFVEHAYPDVSANKLADHARVTLRKFPGLHIDSDSSVQKLHMDSKSELQARECVAELVTTDEGQRWLHAFGSMSAATRYGACARQEFIPMIEKSAYEALRSQLAEAKVQVDVSNHNRKIVQLQEQLAAALREKDELRIAFEAQSKSANLELILKERDQAIQRAEAAEKEIERLKNEK